MPWTPSDAHDKTHKATTEKSQRMWSDVANSALSKTGDDASAIKQANAVVARYRAKHRTDKSK